MGLVQTWMRTRAQRRAARPPWSVDWKSGLRVGLMVGAAQCVVLAIGIGLPIIFLRDVALGPWGIWLAILYIGGIAVLMVWAGFAAAARARGALPRGSLGSKSLLGKMTAIFTASIPAPAVAPMHLPLFPRFRQRGWRQAHSGALPVRGIPFTLGGEHKVIDVVEGTVRGRTARVLYYGVSGEKNATAPTLAFTVVAVFTDGEVPPTTVVPRRLTGLAGLGFDTPGIKVESVEFNRKWRIEGTDTRAAHALMQPVMIGRLLEKDAGERVITWDRNVVMTVRDGFSDDLASLDVDLELLVDLADTMPAYQTRSGAVGSRVREGAMIVAEPPRVELDKVEKVLATIFVILYGLGFIAWLSGVLTLAAIVLLGAASLILAAYLIYAWLRRGRIRRAWLKGLGAPPQG